MDVRDPAHVKSTANIANLGIAYNSVNDAAQSNVVIKYRAPVSSCKRDLIC
jgi:hypothetical protein